MDNNWKNHFPWVTGYPFEIIKSNSKPILNNIEFGVSITNSQFIDIQQTIKIESYSKCCLIDQTFFVSCYSNDRGGVISIDFIESGSISILRCYFWKCYSSSLAHIIYMNLDERNISSAKISMTSLNECGKSEVTHMMRIQWGYIEMSNFNNTWCLANFHCVPCIYWADSEIKYQNLVSNTAKAIIFYAAGKCCLSNSNIVNNTETDTANRDDYKGTICCNFHDTIVRVLSCYICSGNSYLSCSRQGKIIFAQCSLDHNRTQYDSTVLFENNMNSIKMTLFGTYVMNAMIPYVEVQCSRKIKKISQRSVLCYIACIAVLDIKFL